MSGIALNNTFDADRLMTRTGPLTITRDPQTGLVTGTSVGVVQDSFGYNSFGELISYQAGSLYSSNIVRDNLGRVTFNTETVQGVTTTYGYTYDLAGRLTAVTRNSAPWSNYTYDSNGNRIAATVNGQTITATYDAQDRLVSYGGAIFTFDNAGQMRSRTDSFGVTSYTYTPTGKLKSVTRPPALGGNTETFLYDGQDRLTARINNGVLNRQFVYGPDGRIEATIGQGTQLRERYAWGTKTNVPDLVLRGNVIYRIISDQLGSVRLVVNTQNGAVQQRMDYDEFGVLALDTDPGFQNFGFAGGFHNPNVFLLGFGARAYDPAIGRWLTKDPIGFQGGDTNLFGYVLQDPVNYVDPDGLSRSKSDGNPAVGACILGVGLVGIGCLLPNCQPACCIVGVVTGGALCAAAATAEQPSCNPQLQCCPRK